MIMLSPGFKKVKILEIQKGCTGPALRLCLAVMHQA
jgi:hypothetical protein